MKKDFLFKEKQIKSMNKEEFIDCFEGYIIKAGNKYARQHTSLYDCSMKMTTFAQQN